MENKFKFTEWTPELYTELSKPFPKEAIQESKGGQTGKGYDTKGYKLQFLYNRLNELVGPPNWNDIFTVTDEVQRGKALDITGDATVTILGVEKSAPGGHTGYKGKYDTLKGARSNAVKSALRMFGMGRQAWEDSIDEDYQPIPKEYQQPNNNGNNKITDPQLKKLSILIKEVKVAREHSLLSKIVSREITSKKDLSMPEAGMAISYLTLVKLSDEAGINREKMMDNFSLILGKKLSGDSLNKLNKTEKEKLTNVLKKMASEKVVQSIIKKESSLPPKDTMTDEEITEEFLNQEVKNV